jgi:hypothetical protein
MTNIMELGTNKQCDSIWNEINPLNNSDIRLFGIRLLSNVPEYFFHIPASSSGKYHPVGDLGEGGLVRHSITVKRMLTHLLEPNGYYEFTDRQKELLQLAALFHDCMKSGTQEEYEKNPHTKFLHPILAANFIMYCACLYEFPYEDAVFMASAIASHMGQWNTSKHDSGLLPLPKEPHQKVLHLADYLASRQDINMVIKEEEEEPVNEMTNEEATVQEN